MPSVEMFKNAQIYYPLKHIFSLSFMINILLLGEEGVEVRVRSKGCVDFCCMPVLVVKEED